MNASGAAPIRVLVCDDHELVRTGFVTIIDAQQDLVVVGQAEDGESAVRLARQLRPRCRRDGHPDASSRRNRGDATHRGGPDVADPSKVLS